MKWRLEEGNGEAIYEIGVEDNGILTGLNEADLQASLSTLEKMANRCILIIINIIDTYNAIRLYQQVSMLLHQKYYMVPNTLSHTFMPIIKQVIWQQQRQTLGFYIILLIVL